LVVALLCQSCNQAARWHCQDIGLLKCSADLTEEARLPPVWDSHSWQWLQATDCTDCSAEALCNADGPATDACKLWLYVHRASRSQGNINVIEAAAAKGVKKFVLITSIGCGDTKDAPGEQVGVCAVSNVRLKGQAMASSM